MYLAIEFLGYGKDITSQTSRVDDESPHHELPVNGSPRPMVLICMRDSKVSRIRRAGIVNDEAKSDVSLSCARSSRITFIVLCQAFVVLFKVISMRAVEATPKQSSRVDSSSPLLHIP